MRTLRHCGVMAALALGCLAALPCGDAAAKGTEKTIYAFCAQGDLNCPDGSNVRSGVVRDADGNFYGTTWKGGNGNGVGVVYRVTPDGTQTTLHTFCLTDCKDGMNPLSQLVIDKDGSLYGTAEFGGIDNGGTVFKMSRTAKGEWKFNVIYSFCSKQDCVDGANPTAGMTYQGESSGLPYDGKSELFGVTNAGGEQLKGGVVYSLKRKGAKWKLKVIYDFCDTDCRDGSNDWSKPLLDVNGNIFGNTVYGGANNGGTVYEIVRSGKKYHHVVLHSFCSEANCTDGHQSNGRVALDAAGNLYGTTEAGGAQQGGEVFKITPNGTDSELIIVHTFCSPTDCTDGAGPSGVIFGPDGVLYGTTIAGGSSGDGGTIYKIDGTSFKSLYTFADCHINGCENGGNPFADLTIGGDGTLYGTTEYSSPEQSGGAIFTFKP